MERMGLDVTVIDSPWGEGANEEKLAEILKVRTRAGTECRRSLAASLAALIFAGRCLLCTTCCAVQADTEKKIKAVAVVHNETATGADPSQCHLWQACMRTLRISPRHALLAVDTVVLM